MRKCRRAVWGRPEGNRRACGRWPKEHAMETARVLGWRGPEPKCFVLPSLTLELSRPAAGGGEERQWYCQRLVKAEAVKRVRLERIVRPQCTKAGDQAGGGSGSASLPGRKPILNSALPGTAAGSGPAGEMAWFPVAARTFERILEPRPAGGGRRGEWRPQTSRLVK